MKVTFISLGLSTDAIGIRILSSILKSEGHQTQLIFLPTLKDMARRSMGGIYSYDESVINKMVSLCQESQLIGISLMTHHYSIAKLLTQQLKTHLTAPVIWGGIHPTAKPEECLETADLVCTGEGETSVPELVGRLASGRNIDDIPGIWLKLNGQLIANGVGPLAQDLDRLPFPDYSFVDHHMLVDDVLKPMTPENWYDHLCRFFPPFNCHPGQPPKPAYQILSARGCPFNCPFCGEAPLMGNKA